MKTEKKRIPVFTNEADRIKYHRRQKEKKLLTDDYNKSLKDFTVKTIHVKGVENRIKTFKIKRNLTLERMLRRGNLGIKHTEINFPYNTKIK